MTTHRAQRWLIASTLSLMCSMAAAQVASRGQLLYETHCIACHDAQIHWQERRLASDWPKLVAEVRRWQARALLQWGDPDILEVARHLNQTIYRHPQSSGVISQRSPAAPGSIAGGKLAGLTAVSSSP